MTLSATDTSQGYLLGRLFCLLELAEEAATRGSNLTLRNRYYSIASSTPAAVFPHLMRLKNYHLAMIDDKGQETDFDTSIAEILSELQEFQVHLSLEDQGRFAVGYYHQRQSSFNRSQRLKLNEARSCGSPRYLRL